MTDIKALDEKELMEMINRYEQEYIEFMRIDFFPNYDIVFYEIDMEKVESSGYVATAQAHYDIGQDKHYLKVCKNLLPEKFIIFHEFTHIFDAEIFAKRNALSYIGLSGYTEYHASQVELMVLLNAKHITDKPNFSVNDEVLFWGKKVQIIDYINAKHDLASFLFEKETFPENIEMLKNALGILYNYWGLRSICLMHAYNYVEGVDNSSIKTKWTKYFDTTNCFMVGFLDRRQVIESFAPYTLVLTELIGKNGLS